MELRRYPVPLATLAAMSVAAGCGGSSSDLDEERIREVIEAFATEPDPENCTLLTTRRFLDQVEGPDGAAAIAACEARARQGADSFAGAAEVSGIEVSTRLATASVTFEGGINDGQRASVTLVKELEDWRLYSLDEVEIDRPRFEAAVRRGLIADHFTSGNVSCVLDRLSHVTTHQLESAALDGARAQRVFMRPWADCIGNGDPRAAALAIIRRGSMNQGYTRAQARCITERVRDEISQRAARQFFSGRASGDLAAALEAAARGCVTRNAPVPLEEAEGDEPTV